MAVIQGAWILMTLSVFGMAQAFYPIRPPCLPAFSPLPPPPRHEPSCRDTIEDLKALLEITQAMQPNQSYTCPSCSTTFSEEIISKLVNALIYTATQNCGSSYVGGGGGNTGIVSGGSGNSGGLIGGLIGGGNRGSNGEGLIQLGLLDGQDTAHLDLGGQKLLGVDLGQQSGSEGDGGLRGGGGGIPSNGNGRGRPTKGGNTGMMQSPNRGSNGEGLVQVGLLDGQDTAHVDLGGQKLLGVDLGPQSGSGGNAGGLLGGGGGGSNDGLINLGLLNGGNDLLDLGLGGKKLLGVDLGQTE